MYLNGGLIIIIMEKSIIYLTEFVIDGIQPNLEDYENLKVTQVNHYKDYITEYSVPIRVYAITYQLKDEFGTIHNHTEEIYLKGIMNLSNNTNILTYNRIDKKSNFEKVILNYKDYKFIITKDDIIDKYIERK